MLLFVEVVYAGFLSPFFIVLPDPKVFVLAFFLANPPPVLVFEPLDSLPGVLVRSLLLSFPVSETYEESSSSRGFMWLRAAPFTILRIFFSFSAVS